MMKDENMNITITGMIGKRKEKALLKEAAEFFANQLMDPRMARNITLDIEVYNYLDVEGECVDEDGDYCNGGGPLTGTPLDIVIIPDIMGKVQRVAG